MSGSRHDGLARASSSLIQLFSGRRARLRSVAADPEVIEREALKAAQAGFEARQRVARDSAPIEQEIREFEHEQERLLESLYAGAAPALVSTWLTPVQAELQAAVGRLTTVSPSVRMVDPEVLEAVLGEVLGRQDFNLMVVQGLS